MHTHEKLEQFRAHGFREPWCTMLGLILNLERGNITKDEMIIYGKMTVLRAEAKMDEYCQKDAYYHAEADLTMLKAKINTLKEVVSSYPFREQQLLHNLSAQLEGVTQTIESLEELVKSSLNSSVHVTGTD